MALLAEKSALHRREVVHVQRAAVQSAEFGVQVVECSFPNVVNAQVDQVEFVNEQSAEVSVLARLETRARDSSWHCLVDGHPLLEHAHSASSGQRCFSLPLRLPRSCSESTLRGVRLVLRQPSPQVRSFGIRNVKFTCATRNQSAEASSAAETSAAGGAAERVTASAIGGANGIVSWERLAAVSSALQQAWATLQQTSLLSTPKRRRFDVDGSYELSLLSYAGGERTTNADR